MRGLALLFALGWPVAGLSAQEAALDSLREVGNYEAAIAVARRANAQNTLGELLMAVGRPVDAARAFTAAIDLHQADSLRARLNLAVLQFQRGARDSALRAFDRFIDVYNGGGRLTSGELTAVAIAVGYLSVRDPNLARDALRAFDEAVATDSTNLEPRLLLGELFLQRYNGTEARTTFEAVLARHPHHARALLGLARTTRFEGSRQAIELVRQALQRNPRLVAAHALLAELSIELEDYVAAERAIARALETNPRSLRAMALRAAVAYLRGDAARFDATVEQVLSLNPAYAELYTTLAEVAARNRLYTQAADFARRAVALDADAWRGYALLGINQLRNGEMRRGRRNLETGFGGDPFDVWTKNTLDLLDTLDRYPETASPRFRFIVDGKESALLTPYLTEVAESAYDSLAARYGYRPATPIRVEVFPDHVDFSVRTVGLVGLGALGVSFGPVVAMDSPSARDAGAFNWGSTLWHEIAHTFHLGLSHHRVPRWFTEGLAVFEERRARSGWGDDVNPAFLMAYHQDRLLAVSRLNDGFMRPAYPQQIIFSYYQASLVCEMIEQSAGADALVRMLRAYGDGLTTFQVFRRVLGTTPDAFDASFDAWFRERFARPLAAITPPDTTVQVEPTRAGIADLARRRPGDFPAQLAMGQLLLRDGRPAEAIPYLERAKRLFPEYGGDDSPYALLAGIHRANGDLARAAAEFTALTAINERAYEAYGLLAGLRLTLGDTLAAMRALDAAMFIHPYDVGMHRELAELSELNHRYVMAIRERRAVVALDPVDRADALYRLARAHMSANQLDEARRIVLQALEIAPEFAQAQELLLQIHERRGS
ncbi:MAG TPA: tetratricopeptide repeat protein [Gemmatimonadales bacterium]